METWLIFSITASITAGISGFLQKVQSEKKLTITQSFIFYNFFYTLVIGSISLMIFGNGLIVSLPNILYAFIIVGAYSFILDFRIKSLEYVTTSTYFINYRILSSILLLILGQIIFSEIISFKEYLGILLGFFIFFLLLEKKKKGEKPSDFKKGIVYIMYCVGLVAIVQILAKDFMTSGFDPFSLMFFQGIFGIVISLVKYRKIGVKKLLYIKETSTNLFLFLNGFFLYISALFNNFAFNGGDVAIVYKIISYSIFIPIILSMIFYKEKITLNKLIAFILTIISIGLFV